MTTLNQDAVRTQVSAAVIAAGQALDFRDYDGFGDYLTDDCRLYRPTADEPLRGREAIVSGYRKTPPSRLNRHVISNIHVTPDGQDQARAISYVTLFSSDQGDQTDDPKGAPVQRCLVGEFHDQWRRSTQGIWQIAERRARFVLQFPVPEETP